MTGIFTTTLKENEFPNPRVSTPIPLPQIMSLEEMLRHAQANLILRFSEVSVKGKEYPVVRWQIESNTDSYLSTHWKSPTYEAHTLTDAIEQAITFMRQPFWLAELR